MALVKKSITHIGTTEFIDFPEDDILRVPAKIDTGADSSAVWASNIYVGEGVLQFNFFAPGSAFYKIEPTRTTAYKSTVVKNSFGQREVRYKIRVRVRIGERILTTWFSLADRSRNNYPVLLGKTFLKNRFVVDVSKNMLVSTVEGTARTLVLTDKAAEANEFFTKVASTAQTDLVCSCARYDALLFLIDGLRTRILNTADDNRDIGDYALTYFKSHNHNAELAAACAEYLKYKSRKFLDREVSTYTSMSKLSETMRLSLHGNNVPKTICAKTVLLATQYDRIVESLNVPFVLKEAYSDRGKNNYLISKESDFTRILAEANDQQIYLAQQYIKNDGFLRLYVFGGEIDLAVWRQAYPHKEVLKKHLNKPARSVNAIKTALADISPDVIHAAVMAADCMGRQVAGVDMVQSLQTKAWHVLEVNNAPQLRSGSYLTDKVDAVARYFDKELNR